MEPKLFKSISEMKTPIGFLCLTISVTEGLLLALIKTVGGGKYNYNNGGNGYATIFHIVYILFNV